MTINHGICCGGPYNAKHLANQSEVITVAVDRNLPSRTYPGQQASTTERQCLFGDYLFDAPSKTWVWDDLSLRDTLKQPNL